MKQKAPDMFSTIRTIFQEELKNALQNYATRDEVKDIIKQSLKDYPTRNEVKGIVKESLKDHPTRDEVRAIVKTEVKAEMREELKEYPTKVQLELRFEESERKMEDKMREYRNDILTKMDEVMGELAQMREDRLFEKHEKKALEERVNDHEDRISSLEHAPSHP